jgi:hypothetical protein
MMQIAGASSFGWPCRKQVLGKPGILGEKFVFFVCLSFGPLPGIVVSLTFTILFFIRRFGN